MLTLLQFTNESVSYENRLAFGEVTDKSVGIHFLYNTPHASKQAVYQRLWSYPFAFVSFHTSPSFFSFRTLSCTLHKQLKSQSVCLNVKSIDYTYVATVHFCRVAFNQMQDKN